MKDYKKYQHLEKLGSEEVDGILLGQCYVFPKIDGTNTHVWRDDWNLLTGSRNRKLTKNSDNAGFNAYIQANADKYHAVLMRCQKAHIFTESGLCHIA